MLAPRSKPKVHSHRCTVFRADGSSVVGKNDSYWGPSDKYGGSGNTATPHSFKHPVQFGWCELTHSVVAQEHNA